MKRKKKRSRNTRAQLGPDPEQRPYRPREDDASVEDPLKDWPEKS